MIERPAVRVWTWIALAAAGLLMCLSFPVFPNDLQAYGNNLAPPSSWALRLVWHILHPPVTDGAGSTASAELQQRETQGEPVAVVQGS